MPILAPLPKFQAFDANGDPLVGGLLYTYISNSSTATPTYQDSSGTENTNPIELDARGECDLWIDPLTAYKFVLKDADGTTIWTVDNINTVEIDAINASITAAQASADAAAASATAAAASPT